MCKVYSVAMSTRRVCLSRIVQNSFTRSHPGELDVRGRSEFSRFDPRPERPHFSNFGPPAERRPFLWSEDLFVRRRLRSDFSRFDPASPGDGPTLATLVRGADFSNFARGVDRRPFCGGARRCGVEAAPHFSTPWAKATDFSRFCAHLYPVHFSRFDPKVPHFSN